MAEALVLNATYEPLCVVPIRRAVVLVLAEKAIMVEAGDGAGVAQHARRLRFLVGKPGSVPGHRGNAVALSGLDDFVDKVEGSLLYAADWQLPGLLHGKVVRAEVPCARIAAMEVMGLLMVRPPLGPPNTA